MYDLSDYAYDGFRADLEEVSGFAYEKTQLFASMVQEDYDGILFVPCCSKFLLTGPEGYGKSYLANCFSQTLKDAGYSLYRIDCEDIMEEESPENIWKELFDGIMEKTDPDAYDNEKVFLYLENLDVLKDNKKCTKVVASFLKKLSDLDRICIVVSISETGMDIPMPILKQFVVLELDIPDEDSRREFFEKVLGFSVTNPDDPDETIEFSPLDFSVGTEEEAINGFNQLSVLAGFCAEKTEGLSFGQLDLIVNQLVKKAKARLINGTSGNAEFIFSCIQQNNGYIVTEEEFDDIIDRVKQAGKLLEQKETKVESTNSAIMPTQIICAGATPGMQGLQQIGSQGNWMMGGFGGNVTQSQEAYEQFLEAGSGDNPKVSAILELYKAKSKSRE